MIAPLARRRLALVALLVAACRQDATHVRPRASVTEVYAGPVEACDGSTGVVLNPEECELLHQITVVDVRVSGDRVGVLGLIGGTQTGALFLSDDRGRTFRQVSVFGDLIYQLAWDAHAISLVLAGGRAWLVLGTTELGAGNQPAGRARWAEFDLATGELGPFAYDEMLLAGPIEVDDAGVASVVQVGGDPRGGPAVAWLWRRDFAAGTPVSPFEGCSSDTCGTTVWRGRDGGHEWQAFGVLGPMPAFGIEGEACRYLERWASGPSDYHEQLCVPYGSWGAGDPTGPDRFSSVFGVDGLLYAVSDEDGRTAARTILADDLVSPPHLGPELDLGPGTVVHVEGFNGRSRYGDHALVGRPSADGLAESTLVRIDPAGSVEVNVPPWPCDRACGDDPLVHPPYGAVVWMTPLGGDEHLVLYVVDVEGEGLHQEKLYADVVSATTSPPRLDAVVPIPDDTDLPATSPFPAYPHAIPADGLARACQAAELCGLVTRRDDCLAHYATNDFVPGRSIEGSREALIAAAEGGCAELGAALACAESWCPAYGLECLGGTGPDDGITCDGDVSVDPGFCDGRRVGTYCDGSRTVTCNGAGVAQVTGDCGSGASCVPGTGAGEPTASCQRDGCSTTAACVGDVFGDCRLYRHCGDFGQVCDPLGCLTDPAIPLDAQCSWGTTFDRSFCVEDAVMFCLGNRLHFLRCTDLGFTGCAGAPAGARCVP